MTRPTLLLLLITPVIGAAPVPTLSEKDQIEKNWGKVFAPSKKCEFKLDGTALTIRTDGEACFGFGDGADSRMPRVTNAVSGDFEVTVTVKAAATPNPDVEREDSWPWTRAGLFISGGGHAIEFHFSQFYTKFDGKLSQQLTRCVWIEGWFPEGSGGGSEQDQVAANKPVHLRITRKEKVITTSYSFDGKKWFSARTPAASADLPDKVTVGLFVSHTTQQIVDATFTDFKLGKPEKADK
jgi:hypothetical protein